MRCARWALPSGVAAVAADLERGPILLVNDQLGPRERLAVGALALALHAYQLLVVISRHDLDAVMRELERVT